MVTTGLPGVAQVLRRNKLVQRETASSEEEVNAKEFVVVSVFGASNLFRPRKGRNFKQPFRLALDAFGVASLDNDDNPSNSTAKCVPTSTAIPTSTPPPAASLKQNEVQTEITISESETETQSTSAISPTRLPDNSVTSEETTKNIQIVSEDEDSSSTSNNCSIDGFYNEEESVLFLHLEGAYDPHFLLNACKDLQSTMGDPDFIPKWCSLKSKYCQSLLLLFILSHIMILSNTDSYFDTSYIHLFRAIDAVRLTVRPFVSQLLEGVEGLSRNWVNEGRLCSPRVIFFFEVESDVPPRKLIQLITPDESDKSIKSVKENLEDDIYQVLRKCRIITNNSVQSLFTIQKSQDFVYLHKKSLLETDCLNNQQIFSQVILQFCQTYNMCTETPSFSAPNPSVFFSQSEALTDRSVISDYREFMIEHIRAVRECDDRKRSNDQKQMLTRPTWKDWTTAYNILYSYLVIGQHDDSKAVEVTSQLEKYCNIDADYLESQCANMFSKIYGIYQKNITEFYSQKEHETRLGQAVSALMAISRSSGIVPWLQKLELKCERYWKSGHQQCEARSLHEQPCINQLHRVPPGDHLEVIPLPEMDESLPELHHNAGNRLSSYCSCGKRSIHRDEPFTIREANYDFYKRVGKDCCDRLESWEFPVFVPATDGEKELSLKEMLDIIRNKKIIGQNGSIINGLDFEILENDNNSQAVEIQLRQELDDENDSVEDENDNNGTNSNKSNENEGDHNSECEKGQSPVDIEKNVDLLVNVDDLGLESLNFGSPDVEALSQNVLPEEMPTMIFPKEESSFKVPSQVVSNEEENIEPKIPEKLNVHRSSIPIPSSTVEYLPGMLHSKSPIALLPIFPSWSLLCLGYSRIYSHNTGIIHQPGFLGGSNFLLPWDVKVKATDISEPSKPLRTRGIPRGRMNNTRRIRDEFSVKVFVGLEYECKRGHRFFVEGPAKPLFHLNTSEILIKKDAAAKVATADMPLYVKCPCSSREGRDIIAQLLRVHIVTPKAPVNVTLNPRVQPGPHPCPIFTPGNQELIKLTPSAYWVLRLPYSYVGDDRVYVPPQDVTSYNGRLMRNLLGVEAMSASDTKIWKSENMTL